MVRLKPTDWTTAPACWAGICRRNYMGDSSEAKRVRHAASGRIMVSNTGIELPLNLDLSRRDILKIAGYGSLAAFIAACGGGSPGSSGSANVTAKGGSLSIGSNASDPGVKKGLADIVSALTAATGGSTVGVTKATPARFANSYDAYLGGTPEDVFTWFSG